METNEVLSKENNLKEKFNLNDNEMLKMMEFVVDIRDRNIDDIKFKELPQFLKDKINMICIKSNAEIGNTLKNNQITSIKNKIAKELLEEIKEEMYNDKEFDELESDYNEILDMINNQSDLYEKYKESSDNNIYQKILKDAEQYKESEPEKYQRMIKLVDNYSNGFQLNYIKESYEKSNKIKKESMRGMKKINKTLGLINFMFEKETSIGKGKDIYRIYNNFINNYTLPFTKYQKDRFISVFYQVIKFYDVSNIDHYTLIVFTLENLEGISVSNMKKDSNVTLHNFLNNLSKIIDLIM